MAFQEKRYVSEHTRFIRDLLERRPEIAAERRKGRALWWDKQLDPDEQRRFRESRVPQQAYVYRTGG